MSGKRKIIKKQSFFYSIGINIRKIVIDITKREDELREKVEAKIKEELEKRLKWVKCRMAMLDIIENKLAEMKRLAEIARDNDLGFFDKLKIQHRIYVLKREIKALDEESKKDYK